MGSDTLLDRRPPKDASAFPRGETDVLPFEDPVARLSLERFGVRPRPWQRLVMANILDTVEEGEAGAGKLRQVVVLPTGAGKSLCFQVPALLGRGPTLVVYPLLALMSDQGRRLDELGLNHVILRGAMTREARAQALRSIESGEARLVLTNPETLGSPGLLDRLKACAVSHLAVDEAHCVAEWGDSFRPAYLELGSIIKTLEPRVVTAFTATASPPVLARIAELLFGEDPWRLMAGDPDRPNIAYRVEPAISKMHALTRLALEGPPLICFCSSRDGARLVAEALAARLGSRRVRYYHAGLDREEKTAVEHWFMPSKDGVLVATVAFGMGVDKPDLRTVVHWDLPQSVEAYLQESGRAGRDGEPARAVLLLGPDEKPRADDEASRARASALNAWARDSKACRRKGLLALLGDDRAGERACGGCDVCSGTARHVPEGLEPLAAFIRLNAGRFGRKEALLALRGEGVTVCAGWACMGAWERDDLGELLDAALRDGDIREGRDGRLRPAPRRYSRNSSSSSSSSTGAAGGALAALLAALSVFVLRRKAGRGFR